MEIERKFLVKNGEWIYHADNAVNIKQGYLIQNEDSSFRVRIVDDEGYITFKKKYSRMSSHEYEYEIPITEAHDLMYLCPRFLTKERYYNGRWEIDKFYGNNQGLVVAEIELDSEDEEFDRPNWLGEEVTGQYKYYNINLINKPFKEW